MELKLQYGAQFIYLFSQIWNSVQFADIYMAKMF